MVKPSGMKKIKVPIMETGMANTGIMVDRQSWRKMNTTSTTSARASSRVMITSLMETFTTETFSKATT